MAQLATSRGPNQRQELHCNYCERITVHESSDPNQISEWVTLPVGKRAYRQYRECTDCHGGSGILGRPLGCCWTVEMKEDEFNQVYKELKSLREFRDSISSALETVTEASPAVN